MPPRRCSPASPRRRAHKARLGRIVADDSGNRVLEAGHGDARQGVALVHRPRADLQRFVVVGRILRQALQIILVVGARCGTQVLGQTGEALVPAAAVGEQHHPLAEAIALDAIPRSPRLRIALLTRSAGDRPASGMAFSRSRKRRASRRPAVLGGKADVAQLVVLVMNAERRRERRDFRAASTPNIRRSAP